MFMTGGTDKIIVGTQLGMSILFSEKDIRPMGRAAYGVRAIMLSENDRVMDVQKADKPFVLTISENGYGKHTALDEYPTQTRGGKGVKTMQLTEKTGTLVGFKTVEGNEDAVLIDQDGTVIRLTLGEVSTIGRLTQGVRVMRIAEGSRVASVEIVAVSEEDNEETDEIEDAETAIIEESEVSEVSELS